MMAESGQAGNTVRRYLARIVHGTDREPQLEPPCATALVRALNPPTT
jgi:hypothetical protein